jgi:hypothetical protein
MGQMNVVGGIMASKGASYGKLFCIYGCIFPLRNRQLKKILCRSMTSHKLEENA